MKQTGMWVKTDVDAVQSRCETHMRKMISKAIVLRASAGERPPRVPLVYCKRDFENAMIDRAVALPVDCVKFGDDWGTQRGLMIRPALWRECFKSGYAAQFARIHGGGKKVRFHT